MTSVADPLFGLTPFPFDLTAAAVDKANELAAQHGEVYALHFDDGVPWAEAMSDSPFPEKLRNDWNDKRNRAPRGLPVYLGLAPLAKDRQSLARASEGSSLPSSIRDAAIDAELVKHAFHNYARRAVELFDPTFVNLGIEAGELAGRDPTRWAQFVRLYTHVRDKLKTEHPQLKIGISFGLQGLMEARVAGRARSILDKCDYVGVSFYPFMSQFHEKLGARKLSEPPRQWTEPLDWLRNYTHLPLAICETGYTSRSVDVPKYDLHMPGDAELQAQYVRDLGRIAYRDNYSFVIWFLAVDYDNLHDKLPEGDGTNRIWRHTGFLDGNLNPKPAWREWNEWVRRGRLNGGEPHAPSAVIPADIARRIPFGFQRQADVFGGSPDDSFTLLEKEDPPAMKWEFSYKPGRWQWGTRAVQPGALAGAERMKLTVRSDRPGPVFVQLEEISGEAHYIVLVVSEEWQHVDVGLRDLNLDPQKKRDGVLQIEDVRQVLLADNSGESGKTQGKRSVWFADWRFEIASVSNP
jgi:hypothetical protein